MRKIFIIIFIILLFPHSINALELVPNAKSGILIEAKSGKIIFEKVFMKLFFPLIFVIL